MCADAMWLFFFFKQKTAYEMRISDWSSDVCSSDLTDTQGLQIFDNYVAGAAMPSAAGRSFVSVNPATGREWGRFVESGKDDVDRAVQEIGRASCRGRVCQYV